MCIVGDPSTSKSQFLKYVCKFMPFYMHFGQPCNTLTIARYPRIRSIEYPEGFPWLRGKLRDDVELGNTIVNHTFKIMELCCERGIPISIENPHSSYLWKLPVFLKWAERWSPDVVVLDYCRFGTLYRTRIQMNTKIKKKQNKQIH